MTLSSLWGRVIPSLLVVVVAAVSGAAVVVALGVPGVPAAPQEGTVALDQRLKFRPGPKPGLHQEAAVAGVEGDIRPGHPAVLGVRLSRVSLAARLPQHRPGVLEPPSLCLGKASVQEAAAALVAITLGPSALAGALAGSPEAAGAVAVVPPRPVVAGSLVSEAPVRGDLSSWCARSDRMSG